MNLLRDFARVNVNVLKRFLRRNKINPGNGLSMREVNRLMHYPHFTYGEANFFNHPFGFSHSPAFLHSVAEIFGEQIYRFPAKSSTPFIVDCGANIGLSVYYFLKNYPKAEIVAFEPDDAIFRVLQKNLAKLPTSDIKIINKAVWTADTTLNFYSEGSLGGSSMIDYRGKNDIKKVDALDLKSYLNRKVDFLKIDIEGAENEVIFHIGDSLHHVENLFLEYHEIAGREQNLGEILNLLRASGFKYYIRAAADVVKFPFIDRKKEGFSQQLNIFCYRT